MLDVLIDTLNVAGHGRTIVRRRKLELATAGTYTDRGGARLCCRRQLDMAALIAYLRSPREQLDGMDGEDKAVPVWAAKKRHRIVAVFQDDGAAGLEQRSGLTAAMAALGQDEVDGVVVCRLASLDDDLVAQEQLLAEITRLDARVYSLNPDDATELRRTPADPCRQIGQLVPDSGEQTALARIAELRDEGATLREMARALEAEGHRTKRAERWHPESMRRIAKRAGP